MSVLASFNDFWRTIDLNEEYLQIYGQNAVPDWENLSYRDLEEAYENVKPSLEQVKSGQLVHFLPKGMNSFTAENFHKALVIFLNPPERWFGKLWVLDCEEYLNLKNLVVKEERRVLQIITNSENRSPKQTPQHQSRKRKIIAAKDEEFYKFISPEKLYTLKTFKKRLGVSDATLRSARRAGLRVTYLHKQGYVYGRDWIEYVLNSNPEDARHPTSES
ncbi:hypothetical protein [Gimesia aquarii]|uniref:Uncharacterized protein n=1 Tax=Gimesia aquarii TaxID=2527964 RepID=A0A517WX04_9PLAN|nr:hypothetical protein [Gimesia aquarii]QDU09797.1 hypothetical protein V202x_31940 [Gimesia aquarii]